MYLRNNFTGSRADIQRCAGRCKQSAEAMHDGGGIMAEAYLMGAACALYTLLDMEEGNDEETFLTRVTLEFQHRFGGVA